MVCIIAFVFRFVNSFFQNFTRIFLATAAQKSFPYIIEISHAFYRPSERFFYTPVESNGGIKLSLAEEPSWMKALVIPFFTA